MSTDSIKSNLKSAISNVQAASAEKTAADFSSKVAKDSAAAARSSIGHAEGKVTKSQNDLNEVNQKLETPPTKEVDEGGKDGGTKTVVDQDEVNKLNKEKSLVQTQLDGAKRAVEDAKASAQEAANEALVAVGITAEKQVEVDNLMTSVSSIESRLSKGESVGDEEIQGLIDGFNTTKEGLPENKGGVVSEAFYDPFKEGLENILELIENPPTTGQASSGEASPPPAGTLDRELYDVGITDANKISEFTSFVEDFGDFSEKVNSGQSVTESEASAMFERHDALVGPLSSEQKSSDVITNISEDVNSIREVVSGGGVAA